MESNLEKIWKLPWPDWDTIPTSSWKTWEKPDHDSWLSKNWTKLLPNWSLAGGACHKSERFVLIALAS